MLCWLWQVVQTTIGLVPLSTPGFNKEAVVVEERAGVRPIHQILPVALMVQSQLYWPVQPSLALVPTGWSLR